MYKRSPNILTKKIAYFWQFLLACLVTIGITNRINPQAQAAQSPNGTVGFDSAVLLVDSYTTFSGVRIRQATYYFDLELPKNAGESLQKVEIKQRTGSDEIRFRLDKTKAYLGNHNDKQQQLEVSTTQDEETGAITVQLKQAIPPGSKLTIGLKPKSNPDFAGAYLFGITAFPTGSKPQGLYLGAGRLEFYQNSDSLF